MPAPHPSTPLPRNRAESWALAWLTASPRFTRGQSILILLGTIALIGWLDYISSIWFSLQIFYLLPIILSVAWLGWRGGWAPGGFCLTGGVTGASALEPLYRSFRFLYARLGGAYVDFAPARTGATRPLSNRRARASRHRP